jgi:hypothetical protein
VRSDMARVVIERPRRGHSIGLHERNRTTKTRGKVSPQDWELDEEDVDVVVGSKRHPISPNRPENDAYEDKSFSDLLGPLKRYLRKQVGRPWDDVYSELSQHLDKRSLSGQHIWDHVLQEVEQYVWIGESGKVYYKRNYRYAKQPMQVRGLYVHPHSGLLCDTKLSWRASRKPGQKAIRAYHRRLKQLFNVSGDEYRIVDADTLFELREIVTGRKRQQLWFKHVYGIVPESVQTIYNYLGDNKYERIDRVIPAHRGRVSTKQASKKEIKRAGETLKVLS